MASELASVDAVAFDCDGVLVDARKSYDRTIRIVVETMVKGMTGVKLPLTEAAPGLIATVRRTGGFNSDWDTSYALTMFAFVSIRGGDRAGTPLERLVDLTSRFGYRPRKAGVRDADAFLDEEFPSMADAFREASDYLEYPGLPPKSKLATLFDEIYLGAALFRKTHGVSGSGPKEGLVLLEKPLFKSETLKSFEKIVGKGRLAMITGRPSLSTKYSLGKAVMNFFNADASVFIGDADVDPSMRAAYDKFRKPSPEGLVRAKEKLASKVLLYVGDSAEDLMMVRDGLSQGRLQNCLFAGVYGTSPDADEQIAFFKNNGADLIVKTVNEIPARLLAARREGRQPQ